MKRQKGFALVSALFLVVALTLLATAMMRLSTTQQVDQMRDLLGTRAYFAARAGVEWGVYQALQTAAPGTCAASATLPALAGTASNFAVQVQCTQYGPYDEGGNSMHVYHIVATATQGTLGAVNYVERQLQVVVSR